MTKVTLKTGRTWYNPATREIEKQVAGDEIEVDDKQAKILIDRGEAEPAPKKKTRKPKAEKEDAERSTE